MTKEFIPYAEALALKELGFDEPCLAFKSSLDDQLYFIDSTEYDWRNSTMNDDKIVLPLYQQVFRWFREKHALSHEIQHGIKGFYPLIYKDNIIKPKWSGDISSYEEAELACLEKLIEIIKKK